MKKIYERPVVEALEVRKEDIITLSYMLPEMPIDTGDTASETNGDTASETNGETMG